MNKPSPESLLDLVSDRETFVAFVQALANEREQAAEIEKENPTRYMVDGALGWKNAEISSFLEACLYNVEGVCAEASDLPSWRLFAEILYCGKIVE